MVTRPGSGLAVFSAGVFDGRIEGRDFGGRGLGLFFLGRHFAGIDLMEHALPELVVFEDVRGVLELGEIQVRFGGLPAVALVTVLLHEADRRAFKIRGRRSPGGNRGGKGCHDQCRAVVNRTKSNEHG
jgi:hypothetical protein